MPPRRISVLTRPGNSFFAGRGHNSQKGRLLGFEIAPYLPWSAHILIKTPLASGLGCQEVDLSGT